MMKVNLIILTGLLTITLGAKDLVLTPDTMAKYGFSIECRFIDQTITERDKPTRPTGTVFVHVSFEAEKGPAIKAIQTASLLVQDGETMLLRVPVQVSSCQEKTGVRLVQFSVHKEMLSKARLILSEGGQGRPRSFQLNLASFVLPIR